jgi:galactokinase
VTPSGPSELALREAFEQRFGHPPEGVWSAPGRVNLIGEHTDYNLGFVLPLAIDRRTRVALARRDDDSVRAWSAQLGDAPPCRVSSVGEARGGWAAYVAGVAWAMRGAGLDVPGFELAVDSDLPVGAGLSSSAALECATARAVADLVGWREDEMTLAIAAQRAEREVVGAPVGVMDQAVSMCARRGTAMFLDCRSLSFELLELPPDLSPLVVDTHVAHDHATGEYAARRAECEAAAQALGVPALRDADAASLDRLDGVLERRARHVVSENERVLAAVRALRSGRVDEVGALLSGSHASLRDDFEVSVPELDLAVETATEAGAWGARMTGGGFGGSVLVLPRPETAQPIITAVASAFARAGYAAPTAHLVQTDDGARRMEV